MINRCLDDVSHDAEGAFCDKPKNNNFSIQVDESTDFTNRSDVVAFVRFINDGEIQENFFCCKELPETSKGQDIFNAFLHIWENCVGICTDVASSVVCSIRGFTSLVKKKILVSQHTALFTERC
jgi:hypothetical protein